LAILSLIDSEYFESAPSTQRANINERVARLLKTAPKYEDDYVGMEEDNIIQNRKIKYRSVKLKRKTTDRYLLVFVFLL
jgi:hypothetical protein